MNNRLLAVFTPTKRALKNIDGSVIDTIYKFLPEIHYEDCGVLYEFCIRRKDLGMIIGEKYVKDLYIKLLKGKI